MEAEEISTRIRKYGVLAINFNVGKCHKVANLHGSKNNWLNWCFRYNRAENIWKGNVRAHYFETGVKFDIYRVKEAQ